MALLIEPCGIVGISADVAVDVPEGWLCQK